MEWRTLCASLDLGLASHQPEVSFVFLGGEPLLQFPLIRKAVEYVEAGRRPGQHVRFRVCTNGILLHRDITSFFEQHGVQIQLSFDGILPAQDLRAKGTFPKLDLLLDNLRDARPGLFRDGLQISITVTPPAIQYLADSVSYFVGKGCRKIAIEPLLTHHPSWTEEYVNELEYQFSRILDISLDQVQGTGRVPLLLFSSLPKTSQVERWGAVCGATQGRNLAVDIDGQVYGCALCVESVQEFQSPLSQRLRQGVEIGKLNLDFPVAYQRFLERARHEDLLNHRGEKYSHYGRCADCHYFADCAICPVSIAQRPGNMDPHQVPDFPCAFNRMAQKYRGLFLAKAQQARGKYLDQLMLAFHDMVRESAQAQSIDSPAGADAARE